MEPAAEFPSFCVCERALWTGERACRFLINKFANVLNGVFVCMQLIMSRNGERTYTKFISALPWFFLYLLLCCYCPCFVLGLLLFFNFRSRLFHCCLPFNRTEKKKIRRGFFSDFFFLFFRSFAVNIFRTIFCTRYTTRIIYLATEKEIMGNLWNRDKRTNKMRISTGTEEKKIHNFKCSMWKSS